MAIGGSLWKTTQLWRLGQLIQDTASGVARSVLVINRSLFSLHAGTYMYMYHSPPPRLSLYSKRLFLQQATVVGNINNSMSYKVTQCYIFSKYISSQDHCGLMMDLLQPARCSDGAIINYEVTASCSNIFSKHVHSQACCGLMSNILPASHSDVGNTGCERTRSAPMNIEELVEFLQDENASDICVIQVPPHLDYVDYFVVCSGFGGRHLRRMADGLVTEMKLVRVGRSNRRVRVEGEDCEDWMAVDMGTTVVHFMTEEARSKYELEKLWALGSLYDDQYRSMKRILENNP